MLKKLLSLHWSKIITLVLTLNIFMPLPTHSAQTDINQPIGINISPIIITCVSNFLFGAMTAPLVASGIQKIKVLSNEQAALNIDNCIKANQKVVDFVLAQVKKIADVSLDGVVICPLYSESYPIASLSKHIIMAQYVESEILRALENNDSTILNKWKAVIQHEATHIKNNDVFWRAIFELTIPYAIGLTVNYLVNTHNHRSFWSKQFWIFEFGLIAHVLSTYAKSVFCKYQEQRADNNIMNQMPLLVGMRTFLSDFEKLNIKNYTWPQWSYSFVRWYYNLFEEHPLNSVRIKKLNARIAALKKRNHRARA